MCDNYLFYVLIRLVFRVWPAILALIFLTSFLALYPLLVCFCGNIECLFDERTLVSLVPFVSFVHLFPRQGDISAFLVLELSYQVFHRHSTNPFLPFPNFISKKDFKSSLSKRMLVHKETTSVNIKQFFSV